MARLVRLTFQPALYPKQHDAIFCPERYGVVEASTKSGKTTGCIQWLAEQVSRLGGPGRNFWWVAPVYPQAKVAYERLARALPPDLFRRSDGGMWIRWPNKSKLWFKSAEKPDNLYAEDVWAAVIDEATRVRAESWHAVRSTLTFTRGPVRIIGNVKGRKNWAYKMARRAEEQMATRPAATRTMHYAKLTAHDAIEAGVLSADEVADAQEQLPDAVFRELYLAEPSDDANNPFGREHIKACTIKALAAGPSVGFGWDLGRHDDATVGIGLNARAAMAYYIHMLGKPWAYMKKEVVNAIGRAPTVMDATHGSVGDPFVEEVQAAQLTKSLHNVEGFAFTGPSKQQLMEGLQMAIQDHELGVLEGLVTQQLYDFEYEYTRTGVLYRAPEGMHDDAVMALAMAWRAARPLIRKAQAGAPRLPASPRLQQTSPWQGA